MSKALRVLAWVSGPVALLLGLYLAGFYAGLYGDMPTAGELRLTTPTPPPVIVRRAESRRAAGRSVGARSTKQILFGDLHVHTTFSTDAFLWSLPMFGGVGTHPVADACDYARYCSGLDFWAITDHAEASTPRRWRETKAALRRCQAVSGAGPDRDLYAFVGFEWTQVGPTPSEHYGHKNVIFRDLDDARVARRPIAARGAAFTVLRERAQKMPPTIPLVAGAGSGRYFDFNAFIDEVRAQPLCDPEAPSDTLPADCIEVAATPADLVRRLDAQGLDPLIIPHGTTWGFYTPPGTTLDKSLAPAMRPERLGLFEIYSGHGNAEEHRAYRAVEPGEPVDGEARGICPAPVPGHLTACWRAGEIIRERCVAAGEDAATCDRRAAEARAHTANMGVAGHLAIRGESAADWLDAGQCRDCFQPAFNHRPGGSAQYGLALSDFEGPGPPGRFVWGFVGSSDNHRARPGTGFKEALRFGDTDAAGAVDEGWRARILGPDAAPEARSVAISRAELRASAGFQMTEMERQSSFWLTGGLAAVHATERSRAGIWDALKRRETYATSGPRILLWFDLVEAGTGARHPMGSVVASTAPRFEVRAVGAFEQQPGCPERTWGDPALAREICGGVCDNPSDRRHRIERIEVVRIRPQVRPGEPVADLIDDPFLVHRCPPSPAGCRFEFEDPSFAAGGRDATYYVRAVQEATPTINADNLRCRFDADGDCVEVDPCYGDYRVDREDACRAPSQHRAWSSPIYVTHGSPPGETP